ncbi:cysteinyl-tRNA synthetase [Litorimonas taeanensis]|uniref:Cysteine--tRNA ligase n=1 Tax=Litorimonas taeanensis TaxID=568099 RepID=A0A420WE55_9PROT|nr:cysteine--tRNA ligase [Litorimonas taeanensis]RKQ69182.1 cysteinyl-tRNA synthetase [Litorimonas taeanensis]
MTEQPQLTLYNSLTRRKEDFTPQDPKRVTMYNCGPTVYSYAHIGNARAAVVADVLFRVLRHIYGEDHVVYARNITDVDDKIIASAKEQGVPISDITEKYARIYNEDLAAIGCLPPTHQPKATVHIPHMIEMISELIEKDFAYESDGHVFFDVSKYDDYGKLSGNSLKALKGGDRVGEGETARKRNSADFVLWKPELDGVGWDAPFGKGRPGWHIECSAMAKATLGETIDIHCGGVDLKFPHHENEIAQSCCANDTKTFAKFWIHNEFLNMGSEKMSKSLGNVTLIHDLLKEWDGEVIRLALLKAHYRSELQWSEDLLKESKANLDRWYRNLLKIREIAALPESERRGLHYSNKRLLAIRRKNRNSSMYDDLDTVQVFYQMLNEDKELTYYFSAPPLNEFSQTSAAEDAETFLVRANLLGLLQKDPEDWFKGGASADEEADFNAIANRRAEARKAKDWAAADAARDEAKALGIVLEDNPDGTTTWRKA